MFLLGRGLYGAITLYKSLCEELQYKINRHRLALFNEFFFNTFMTHYRLYQVVTSGCPEREHCTANLTLPVTKPPSSFMPLVEGKEPDIYEYEKKIEQMAILHSQSQETRRIQQQIVTKEDAEKQSTVQSSCDEQFAPFVTQKVGIILKTIGQCSRLL